MQRLLAIAVSICTLAGFAPAPAGAALAKHSKQRAELNILRSASFFWQAGIHRLIRTRTRTFRTNVTVTCGRKLSSLTRQHVFSCILAYRADRIHVRYTALGAKTFHLKITAV